MFRATNIGNMVDVYNALFTNFGSGSTLTIDSALWLYLGLFILSDLLLFNSRFDVWCENKPLVVRWLIYGLVVFLTMACSSVNNFQFIYFQF